MVSVSNPFREKRFFILTYKSDLNKAGEPLEKFADVYLMLDKGLLDAWKVSGCKGSGFKQVSDNIFLMTDREVVLDNLYLNPDEHHTIQTAFRENLIEQRISNTGYAVLSTEM